MIPRYSPSFTLSDIISSYSLINDDLVVSQLEEEISKIFGVKHVLLFSSARAALCAILVGYGRPGPVKVPAYNCIVVPEAIQCAGYYPQFIDTAAGSVNSQYQNESNYSVIVPTYQFGIPFDVSQTISNAHDNDALVIEDISAAFGAKFNNDFVGKNGDASIISFGKSKIISGIGGGCVLTNNDDLFEKIKRLKLNNNYASNYISLASAINWLTLTKKVTYKVLSNIYNTIVDDGLYTVEKPKICNKENYIQPINNFQAALIQSQLTRFDGNVIRRNHIASIYCSEISETKKIKKIIVPDGAYPAWLQYPIFVKDKKKFYTYMRQNRVDLSWTYKYSCPESYKLSGYLNSRSAAKSILGLPTYPALEFNDVELICQLVNSYEE